MDTPDKRGVDDRSVRIPGPEQPKLSKTQGKKLLNAVLVQSRQHSTNYDEMKQRCAQLSAQLVSAASVLEAVVRRHGTQVFDRAEVQGRCGAGRIKWDVTDTRITLSLNELELVSD